MLELWKETIWRQFGAAIDSLEVAIRDCPEQVWGDRVHQSEFWYIASHTIFFLDYYMSESVEGFMPPEPFGLEELDERGVLPPRVYSREELLTYLEYGRSKARAAVRRLTEQNAHEDCGEKRPGITNAELLLYNMRHLQHHAAQLNLMLRQQIDSAPRWVSKAKMPLVDA